MADNPQVEVEISSVSGDATDIRNITGTVSLPTGAATQAAQTDGSQQSKIRGNTDGTLIGNIGDALKVTSSAPKTFVVRQNAVQIANNKSMLSIQNATGSSIKVKIREIWIKNVQTAGVTGIVSQWELNRFTSHSGGTLLTPQAYESSDVLNSSITARTGATISGTEFTFFRWLWSTDEWGTGPQDVESSDHALQNVTPIYRAQPNMKPITLLANEAIHLKQTFNSTVGTFDIEIVFTEETT